MPHMANLPWLEMYFMMSCLWFIFFLKMKTTKTLSTMTNDNKSILLFWSC